jgi:ATP-dependent protease ClpP protease subunit
MKKFLLIVSFLVLLVGLASPPTGLCAEASPTDKPICKSPYRFSSDCTACHVPPTGAVMTKDVAIAKDTIYLSIRGIEFNELRNTFLALKDYQYNKIIIDLLSFGGSVFDALGMVALIEEQQKAGKVVEIRARGIVASAGLIVMVSGTPGHRLIGKHSLVMFHEMWSFKFMAVETPADKEEEAKIFRMIQDKINNYIASKSRIPEADLCGLIKKKEFWVDAKGAIGYGFADKLIE